MDRGCLIKKLIDLSGPNGPFAPFNTADQLLALMSKFYESIAFEDLDTLLDILINPPDLTEWNLIVSNDFEIELVESIIYLGKMNAVVCLKK